MINSCTALRRGAGSYWTARSLLLDIKLILSKFETMKGKKYNTHNIKLFDLKDSYEIIMYENATYSLAEGHHERAKSKPIAELSDDELDRRYQQRVKNAMKKKIEVQRLIQANLSKNSFFITLTYKEDKGLEDLDKCFADFKYFITKLNKHFNKIDSKRIVKYIATWEYKTDEKGNSRHLHFHAFIDVPFKKKIYITNKLLSKLWKHGFTNIKDIHAPYNGEIQTPANISRYITKYITKDCMKSNYRKNLLISRNLTKIKEQKYLIDLHSDTKELKELLQQTKVYTYTRYHYATENPNSRVIKLYIDKKTYSKYQNALTNNLKV